MSTLEDTMNAARNAAANVPATQDATTTAVAPQSNASYSVGLDDFLTGGGVRPDKWLQVKDGGIRIDRDDKAFVTEFTGDLDLSSVLLFMGVRAEFSGNNVQYAKSYDGKVTDRGENFNQVVAEFKAGSVKNADPYRGADILIELTEPVTQGKVTIPAGTKVGYSTSITGFAPFQSFLASMVKQGKASAIPGSNRINGETVKVKVTHEVKTNPKNQDYGILNFELA